VGDEARDVSLFISNGESARYVALSHCWGGASIIQTTMSLLEEFQQHIKYEHLSKTIQDAVHVTRELGIRYLWVDSLCIVQDDDKDWYREAKTMASVYEGAYCTIAATAAKDGTKGLFLPRPPQNLVEVPCDPTDPTSGGMYLGVKDETSVTGLFFGPLNSRAWVRQEHLFSRRTIHFASEQVYWECDKHLLAEDNEATADPTLGPLGIITSHATLERRSCLYQKLSQPMKTLSGPSPISIPFGVRTLFSSVAVDLLEQVISFQLCIH
jgi:hypothetical protein